MCNRFARIIGCFTLLCACGLGTGCYQKPGTATTPVAPGNVEPQYEGTLDKAESGRIAGWAWDKNRPDEPVSLDIFDGDSLLGTVTADQFREGLKKVGKGNGKHSFAFTPPAALADGKPHVIRVVIAGTRIGIHNSPHGLDKSDGIRPDTAKTQPPASDGKK